MTWTAIGVGLAAIGTGASISTSEKAKKTAKHGKERAIGKSREMADKAAKKSRIDKATALTEKRKRFADVGRNLNIFSSSLSNADQAMATKKVLTGQ